MVGVVTTSAADGLKLRASRSADRSLTCGSSLQSSSVRSDKTRISSLSRFSHSDLERTSWDVGAVELHVNRVDAVLPRDEADGVHVCLRTQTQFVNRRPGPPSPSPPWTRVEPKPTSVQLRDHTLLQGSGGAVHFGLHLALRAIQVHCKGCWVIHL